MACPSKRHVWYWLNDLERWRAKCHTLISQEVENGCDDPVQWRDGDPSGSNPESTLSDVDLGSLRDWKIRDPPDNPSVDAKVDVWRPKNVRLSDAGVIYALLVLPRDYRVRHLAYDFDAQGDVRKERVPKAPTVTVFQNNQRTLITWKGVYIFTGGYNDAG